MFEREKLPGAAGIFAPIKARNNEFASRLGNSFKDGPPPIDAEWDRMNLCVLYAHALSHISLLEQRVQDLERQLPGPSVEATLL